MAEERTLKNYKDINMKLKRDQDVQLQKLQEKIDSEDEICEDIYVTFLDKEKLLENFRIHRESLKVALLNNRLLKSQKHELKLLMKELDKFKAKLNRKFVNFCYLTDTDVHELQELIDLPDTDDEEQQGLNPQRVKQFEQFSADESFVGDQNTICMEDVDVGRNMMRLDCDIQHAFCQVCIERWFTKRKTCPICRHEFQFSNLA